MKISQNMIQQTKNFFVSLTAVLFAMLDKKQNKTNDRDNEHDHRQLGEPEVRRIAAVVFGEPPEPFLRVAHFVSSSGFGSSGAAGVGAGVKP